MRTNLTDREKLRDALVAEIADSAKLTAGHFILERQRRTTPALAGSNIWQEAAMLVESLPSHTCVVLSTAEARTIDPEDKTLRMQANLAMTVITIPEIDEADQATDEEDLFERLLVASHHLVTGAEHPGRAYRVTAWGEIDTPQGVSLLARQITLTRPLLYK